MPGIGIGPFRVGISKRGNLYASAFGFRTSTRNSNSYSSTRSSRANINEWHPQCAATTKAGHQCSRAGRYDGYCQVHYDMYGTKNSYVPSNTYNPTYNYLPMNAYFPPPPTIPYFTKEQKKWSKLNAKIVHKQVARKDITVVEFFLLIFCIIWIYSAFVFFSNIFLIVMSLITIILICLTEVKKYTLIKEIDILESELLLAENSLKSSHSSP